MNDIEFNLLDEPWIRVIDDNCRVYELSLTEALIKSHEIKELKGELSAQDTAILRVMLAVLYSVFMKVDGAGKEKPIMSLEDAYDRWEELWNNRKIPEKPLRQYLEQWHEHFWLFHPTFPFFQAPGASKGTLYSASKLNGEMSESSNKVKLFPVRTGKKKDTLSYAEAARWLIYINAFDDTSAKPKGKSLPSPGAGWLGKLGLIYAEGQNLYETLILNLVLLKNAHTLWQKGTPAWELEKPEERERIEIAVPENPAELYTLQSRRILLQRKEEKVTGYTLLGGSFFDRVNADSEQMTIWGMKKDKGKETGSFQPRRHSAAKKLWREFPSVFSREGRKRPGIVDWIDQLNEYGLLEEEYIPFRIVSVQYGDKDFFVTDVFTDRLEFHKGLLTDPAARTGWITRIQNEIGKCDETARYLHYLERDLKLAAGDKDGNYGRVEERFYELLDEPFRQWLYSLDPEKSLMDSEQCFQRWENTAKTIAGKLGKIIVEEAGEAAFCGRLIKENEKDTGRYYSSPKAINDFQLNLNKVYPLIGKGGVKKNEQIQGEGSC